MKKRYYFLLAMFLIIIDQIAKFYFKNKNYGVINYSTNKGVLFGILQKSNIFVIILSIFIIILLFYLLFTKKYSLSIVFIISGVLSNFIDRIIYGYVIDFIDLKFWPVFNLADVFTIIGVVILLIQIWYK